MIADHFLLCSVCLSLATVYVKRGELPWAHALDPREGAGGTWGQVWQQHYLNFTSDLWISSRHSYWWPPPSERPDPLPGIMRTMETSEAPCGYIREALTSIVGAKDLGAQWRQESAWVEECSRRTSRTLKRKRGFPCHLCPRGKK